MCADTAVVKQILDLIGRRSWARGPTIQIYTAGNGAAVGESYDYTNLSCNLIGALKFLSLAQRLCPNSPDPFPSLRVGSGDKTMFNLAHGSTGGGHVQVNQLKPRTPIYAYTEHAQLFY